jgi:hypothetical protein
VSKRHLKNDPLTVRVLSKATDSWMYENSRSLDIVVEMLGHPTTTVRVTRAQIDAWIRRSDAK